MTSGSTATATANGSPVFQSGQDRPRQAYVLDTSAVLALLNKEPGEKMVSEVLQDPAGTSLMHAINLCEVLYKLRIVEERARMAGLPPPIPDAVGAIESLYSLGIQSRRDLSRDFWQDTAELKVRFQQASLADCVCAALARSLGAELVTADHPSFDPMNQQGACSIRFIR